MAIGSIPPDAKEDSRWTDRHGERGGFILSADAERLRHESWGRYRSVDRGIVGALLQCAARQSKRLVLPGIELAVAGWPIGLSRRKVDRRSARCAAAGGCEAIPDRSRRAVDGPGRATRQVTGQTDCRRRGLCSKGCTGGHDPHDLSSAADHCDVSLKHLSLSYAAQFTLVAGGAFLGMLQASFL